MYKQSYLHVIYRHNLFTCEWAAVREICPLSLFDVGLKVQWWVGHIWGILSANARWYRNILITSRHVEESRYAWHVGYSWKSSGEGFFNPVCYTLFVGIYAESIPRNPFFLEFLFCTSCVAKFVVNWSKVCCLLKIWGFFYPQFTNFADVKNG